MPSLTPKTFLNSISMLAEKLIDKYIVDDSSETVSIHRSLLYIVMVNSGQNTTGNDDTRFATDSLREVIW